MATNPEKPVGKPYFHSSDSVKEHLDDLHDQAKNPRAGNGERDVPMEHVVFQRRHITLLNRALRNPNHRLRQAAERAMQGFTMDAERDEIITLNQAEKEYGIPNTSLSGWVAKGIIPYANRDEYAIYVRKDMLDKIAPVYHQAKEQGKLAAPILKKMRDELFPDNSPSSRK
jgi:hypothetical protein